MSLPVSRSNAPHYVWGNVCDGWRLVATPGLSVIEERVPPGAAEVRHRHDKAAQFFYILSGEAVIELDGTRHVVRASSGLEVPAGVPHTFMNASSADVVFLVISAPSTQGDRINLE